MRFLLLALMIALLPVRGWMGNAMAVDMALQAVVKAHKSAGAAPSPSADTPMPADCPMLAQSADPETTVAETQTSGPHCNACDTCELCLALATSTWPVLVATAATPHVAPLASGYRFSSADRFTSLKPPIS